MFTTAGLEQQLNELFHQAARRAFGDEAADFDPVVRPSKHGDLQVNGALTLAKRLARPPRDVATALVEHLEHGEVLSATEIAGPGFINCTFSLGYLADRLKAQISDSNLGIGRSEQPHTCVLDYSSPNIAKNMHVGNLRTTIIGDSLARLFCARGDKVIGQNHWGDWGTPFGMLIEHLTDSGDVDAAATAALNDLDGFYRDARAKFDGDESFANRSRKRVVALQSSDPETLALWRRLVDVSLQYAHATYKQLGVLLTHDDDRGESFYNDMLDDTIEELQRKGLIEQSQGALCVFPPGFVGRDGERFPLIVRKSEGGYGYAATDLATVRYSVDTLHGNRLVYVTDARQAQHFAMIFAVCRLAGWLPESVEAVHVGFGTVLGKDGKPLKSRQGEAVTLDALVNEAIERAGQAITERNVDIDDVERERIARAVGVGALKWADLKNEHTGNYVFDFDRMLAFNGNTGPYVQYATTRAKSVLRKAAVAISAGNIDGGSTDGDSDTVLSEFLLAEEAERQLALQLPELGTVVARATEQCEPHQLTAYLYELAERFTSFYENCPVLNVEDPAVRNSRLALCALTARVLDRGLGLLGIDTLERM